MATSLPRHGLPTMGTKQSFRTLLEKTDVFAIVAELVTSRGLITERNGRKVLEVGRALSTDPRLHAVSITDNPGGHAMLSADTMGVDLISRGQEVIIHLSCKDWNRNALESRCWKLASEGFQNVLTLSGDYPVTGFQGQAAPVFDIDSVGLLELLSQTNGADFFLGAVVSNFKRLEREVMPQYFKLAKKLRSGARFIINQIGYDSRKQDELLKYMELHGMRVPVLANVYVLGLPAARFFHAGRIPGVTVTDELLAVVEKQTTSPDRGRAFFLELAAKQCAIAKGLGFRGIYLGGHLRLDDYDRILRTVDSFGDEDWIGFARDIRFSQPGEFYYFEQDSNTGLSSMEISSDYLRTNANPPATDLQYKASRLVHKLFFEEKSRGFRVGQALYQIVERSPRLSHALHRAEHTLKALALDCRDCGDCSLPEIAYLCPESQCAKNQRNGPCGGTRQGFCEVGDKECIWCRAYDRLKSYGEAEHMLEGPVVFRDGALRGTSAWANAFLGRDHRGRKSSSS